MKVIIRIKKCNPNKLLQYSMLIANSFGLLTTYLNSAFNFTWHTGVTDKTLIQSYDDWQGWEPYVLGSSIAMCVLIFLNNQNSMSNHIAKWVNHIYRKPVFTIETEQKLTKTAQFIEIGGSISKALISTSSLLASLLDMTGNWPVSLAISTLILFGNFGATFVVTKQHTPWRASWSKRTALLAAWFICLSYGGSQWFLYMNATFNPLLLTGTLKKRPGFYNTDRTGFIIFMVNLYPSLEFMISSGASMYHRSLEVLRPVSPENHPVEFKVMVPKPYEKWRGAVASSYRSVALLAAIFCFFYAWLNDIELSAGITAPFILAIPGIFALLYPIRESKQQPLTVLSDSSSLLIINAPQSLSTPLLGTTDRDADQSLTFLQV